MFLRAKKDIMYDLLKCEDVNWRVYNLQTAKSVYQQNTLGHIRAFALDASIKTPRERACEVFGQTEYSSLASIP